MRIQKRLAAASATLLILLNSIPVFALESQELSEKNSFWDNTVSTVADNSKDNPDFAGTLAFHPELKVSFQNYMIEALLTDSKLDDSLVHPLYSLDGETYRDCGDAWEICPFDAQYKFRLYASCEPLKGYLAREIDCFYLKLHITRKNGTTYETQPALIDRGRPQPLPENIQPRAMFSHTIAVINTKPFDYYGGYQLTVNENATAEEILSYLPDTFPVQISLNMGKTLFADGIIDCPVTWKPLSLPVLTAGETITIADAAREIIVPKGTQIHTPVGIFQLNEPLPLDESASDALYPLTDEVRLILNIVSEEENPIGVLSQERDGLELAFHLKPTGATAIHAYTFSEGDSKWTKIPDLCLPDIVNAYPSSKSSGYTVAVPNTLEPYCSYLRAQNTGKKPTPFFLGLEIEGGIYDRKQIILPWPDTYELPMKLPEIGGSGGNHNNAGDESREDSTDSGQRPNLPQAPENKPQAIQLPDETPQIPDSESKIYGTANEQQPNISSKPETTASPNAGENAAAKPQMPTILNIPESTSGYKLPLNFNEHIRRIFAPCNTVKIPAIVHTKARNTETMADAKTSTRTEFTLPASVRSKARVSEPRDSTRQKTHTDRGENSGRNAKNKNPNVLLAAAAIAGFSLSFLGIFFFIVKKMLRRYPGKK